MNTKETICTNCGKQLEYWTEGDFIECTGCKAQVQVEPCETETRLQPETNEDNETIRVDV